MKLTSVIVWYNPLELKSPHSAVANIHTYSAQFDKVYIVDNSNTDNSKIAQKISNAVYIPLMKNYGIAYALNRGFEKAMEADYPGMSICDRIFTENLNFNAAGVVSVRKIRENPDITAVYIANPGNYTICERLQEGAAGTPGRKLVIITNDLIDADQE